MARTTAQRRRQRAQMRDRLQHYSPQVTAPLHSNSGQPVAGSPAYSGDSTATIHDYPGYRRASRQGWARPVNTNTQVARGGISTYYRGREVGYSA